jgi:hypothetical protein
MWGHCSSLFLADHMHDFNARERGTSRWKTLESEHWLDNALDQTMVLLDNVVSVFDHPMLNHDSEIFK